MAKDFDFVRRTPPVKQITPTQLRQPEPAKETLPTQEEPKAKPVKHYHFVGWGVAFLIVASAVILTYLYYISLQKSSTNTNTNTTSQATTKTTELSVTVYDRGAGSEITDAAVNTIKGAAYSTKSGTESSLVYDKSYIFYNTNYSQEASTIARLFSDRTFELKESPLPNISVYLGKN